MARAIWSGSISFGLLNVPVRMYSAVARRNIALREIRESDSSRIKHRRVAEGTDEEVPYDEIIKAYELTPGQYVPLTKDEMAALKLLAPLVTPESIPMVTGAEPGSTRRGEGETDLERLKGLTMRYDDE